ncbi:hypothetical protein OR37_03474 [Caulobacter vibrioides OR37]|uniref:Uncharacterized protein n=2 Tax=Caulobacteraceae TaxID=76892 RepID=R0CVW8_CAUVI|nr:hypothetical protein OR37_03474 [Caulobacter vibrioides OR37]
MSSLHPTVKLGPSQQRVFKMNVSSLSAVRPQMAVRAPEALERGPDRDGDADDGGKTAAIKAAPAQGTGLRVDTTA